MSQNDRRTPNIDRAIVVGVGLKSDNFLELKESLAELEELTLAAGAQVVGAAVQTLTQYQSATLMGTGKLNEIQKLVTDSEANLVIVDHQLSGVQTRNLEQTLGVRVLDRNQLILDIFAQRAQTYEGQLQVELAQMLDQLPRMVGAWMGSLSRQGGGGVGTRGPGETALELDRRRIKNRVKQIRKKLDSISQHRARHRSKRQRKEVPSFALIGYTNSGKSTLLNRLTNSQVMTKDQVFATLDPTTRRVHLPEVGIAVVTDTVGFIRKLPTHLIEAFKATLEEAANADILVHVIDLSSPQMERQIEVVHQLIKDLQWEDKPIVYVYNKVDKSSFDQQFRVQGFPRAFVSATKGKGIERLRQLMAQSLRELDKEVELYFPKKDEHRIYELGRQSQIKRSETGSQGTLCSASMTPSQLSRWQKYVVQDKKRD